MPFITEEIWHYLPGDRISIMISPWPKAKAQERDYKAEEDMSLVTEVIRAIRNLRSEVRVTPGRKVRVILVSREEKIRKLLEESRIYFSALAQAEPVDILDLDKVDKRGLKAISSVCGGVEVYLPLEGLVDFEREIARLEKELATTQKELERVQKKLANPDFLAKAPAEVVEKERNRAEELKTKEGALRQRLFSLKDQR
jgi:valyl-tRNA synthetase